MPLSSINAAAGSTASITGNRRGIADNFDTFLTLLTTQLKNQNPLDPLDTNQFTQQMVQFTSVEQQLKTNKFLETLANSAQNGSNVQAVSFIGRKVTAQGAQASLTNSTATWQYTLDRPAPNSQITIRDAQGNTVHTEELALTNGNGEYVWNGRDASGNQYPDGAYSITIEARDANNSPVTATTQISGVVSGVDLSGDAPVLLVNGSRVNLTSISAVEAV